MMTPEEYARKGGGQCPNCGESDIEGDSISVENAGAYQPMWCLSCDTEWYDDHRLVGYTNLKVPQDEEEQ